MTFPVTILSKLVSALRSMPCACIEVGSWPLFKAETKVHKPKQCSRCEALDLYDAHVAIVQIPGVPPAQGES